MVVISTTGSSALPPSLGQHAMVPNPDASNPGFFLFGGIDAAGNASSQLWQFSITSGTFFSRTKYSYLSQQIRGTVECSGRVD